VVAWDWDVKSGRDVWRGDLGMMFGIDERCHHGRIEDFRHRVHPDDRGMVWAAVAEAKAQRSRYRATFRIVRTDGATRWVDAVGNFQYAADDTAVRMVGIAIDVTERRQMEAALKEREARFRLMADSVPVLLWITDRDGDVEYCNRALLEFVGRALDQQIGAGWEDSVHPADLDRCRESYRAAATDRAPFRVEHRIRRHDDAYRWMLVAGVPRFDATNTFAGYIGSAMDVTDQRNAHRALSNLSHRLMNTQEHERIRLARVLDHDVAQYLALMSLELDALTDCLAAPSGNVSKRLDCLRARTVDLERRVQLLSQGLYSTKLELLGLSTTAASYCRELSVRHDVAVHFQHDDVPLDLPVDVALALFRVLQEALTNAVLHARVAYVAVVLRANGTALDLDVRDTGIGFDTAAAHDGGGVGLVSMHERIARVGGSFVVVSQPGAGTAVHARVPIERAPLSRVPLE
jgi:PAS domain S-box-containing protein